MGDKECNEAVEKIIGNMTAEMQNSDVQYAPLGFTPPPTEPLSWPRAPYFPPYNPNFVQFGVQYPYVQQPYDLNDYKNGCYNVYDNGNAEVFSGILSSNLHQDRYLHEPVSQSSGHGHLIENLVGNWTPNTTGTYSPFGNVDPFKSTGVFEQASDKENEQILEPLEEKFFNRSRKPRMVAEVKPMRPSYSDVLIKPVPPTASNKPVKTDLKEPKTKKESGKNKGKTEKTPKVGVMLNRSSTNSDIRDLPVTDKTPQFVKFDKEKKHKGQLNRKWASLDNINEPLNSPKIEVTNSTKKKKHEETINNANKCFIKNACFRKFTKIGDVNETESGSSKNEIFNLSKNGVKKTNKFSARSKNSESFGVSERPPGKRNQRARKRESSIFAGVVGQKVKHYLKGWWKILSVFFFWLLHLISDVCSLSLHIGRDMATNFYLWLGLHCALTMATLATIFKRIRFFTWLYEKINPPKPPPQTSTPSFLHPGLPTNITMPTTGDEAMKRLLACKGKDPYSILGVTPACSDDDIKRYYKRQAFLVHPDKNQQPGAEEAFKILVHAFDMIGEPERRAAYDKGVVESVQVEQAWSELTELLQQLQQKVEAAQNTIRCSACGARHKRVKVERPCYAARNCAGCRIHHSAREGDIWAEAGCWGLLWHYYACMEGAVYDITEWAGCQKDSLKHLKPDSHQVQYRIALGKQKEPRRSSGKDKPPDLENLLNTLYGQAEGMQGTKKKKKAK